MAPRVSILKNVAQDYTGRNLMTAAQILAELEPLGSEGYRNVMRNHGVTGPNFGVKIEELKKIVKREKVNYQLALDLYATGVYDAMYLAGLLADDAKMTRQDLDLWVNGAYCSPLATSTVPWVTVGSAIGWETSLEWIESSRALTATAGWAALAGISTVKPDHDLDLKAYEILLHRAAEQIHSAPDSVRLQMNSFVICVGGYVTSLTDLALHIGDQIGKVDADMGKTACKIPSIREYIQKMEARGNLGNKKKTVKC